MRTTAQGQTQIQAIRGRHLFTIATKPIALPASPWPLTNAANTSTPCVRWTQRAAVAEFSSTMGSGPMLLIHVTWLPMPRASFPLSYMKQSARSPRRRTLARGNVPERPIWQPLGPSLATFLTLSSLKCWPILRGVSCRRNLFTCPGGAKHRCSTSRLRSIMSCGWAT